MKVLEIIKKLEKSKEFLTYRKENKPADAFLAHAFLMLDENNKGDWQFGYFNKKDEKMTSFYCGSEIEVSQDAEVFKKPGTTVANLDLKKVKTEFEEAKATAEDVLEKKYGGEEALKKIFILQNLDKQVWNITYLTKKYNIINIKIDSETGKIIKDEATSIMSFKAG